MGVLRPKMANANYSTSGQLSPLFNDPYYETIGIGTAIFLGGARGFVAWPGTQHNPNVPRTEKGIPREGSGTIAVIGNLKEMDPRWLIGASILGYGVSLYVGIGVPIPLLNERMARRAAVRDEDIVMNVFDYGMDVPSGNPKSLGEVTFKDLRSGAVTLNGRKIPSAPLSSYFKAQEIAALLKERIEKGEFFLGEPQWTLPSVSPDKKGP